jgi:hypothetical protein
MEDDNRFCSLTNWIAGIIGNIRFCPQLHALLAVPTTPPHPSKLNMPAFWILVPFHRSQVLDSLHHKQDSDV